MSEKDVTVLIGAGAMGLAIARRVAAGGHILLADLNEKNLETSSKTLERAGFKVSTETLDVTDRASIQSLCKKASDLGSVTHLILATGVSPSHASQELILKVDLYAPALVLEEFESVIAPKGAALVIGSQSHYRMKALGEDLDRKLATTPAEELMNLEVIQEAKTKNPLYTYQLAKRCTSLRVQSEAVRWGKKGARVNCLSPGIVVTGLSEKELEGEHADQYRRMIEACPAKRAGTPDEIAFMGSYLLKPESAYITGSDFLMDGGATAASKYGDLEFDY